MHYGRMAIGSDWQRVAEYVRERRTDLGMTQADVQAAGGPATATQRLIEGALRDSYQAAILARLERVLQWERGSIRSIRRGGEPVPVAPASGAAGSDAELADLEERERRIGVDLSALPTKQRLAFVGNYERLDARMTALERQARERGA
jgi:hypothetical protein